jgi:exodeoxyribonuclease V alpha subunit
VPGTRRACPQNLRVATVGVRDFLAAINGIGHGAVAWNPQFRAALATHGYTLDDTGEIPELAEYIGPFSARAAQIGRNLDRHVAGTRADGGAGPPPPELSGHDKTAGESGGRGIRTHEEL